MIFQVGSEIATHKTGADNDSGIEEESEDNTSNGRTPCQQDFKRGKANTSNEPYETPFTLRTKPWAPSVVEADDTEVEDSESEKVLSVTKGKKAMMKVSSGDKLGVVDD